MKYAFVAALLSIGLVAPSAVRADTIFNVSETLSGGTSLTGTVTIDTTAGMVTAVDLLTTGTIAEGPFTGITSQGTTATTPGYYYFDTNVIAGYYLIVDFDAATLTDYAGGPLCEGLSPNCTSSSGVAVTTLNSTLGGAVASALFGSLTPVATPEPSSIILLGTGVLGLIGMTLVRKRLA